MSVLDPKMPSMAADKTGNKDNSLESKSAALEAIAREIRLRILDMVYTAQSGHPAPSLSAADIVAALYFEVLRIDPNNPLWADRDRFVLSKGHACPVQYTALSMRGFFPVDELKTLRRIGSRLQGHPVGGKLPGLEVTSGSLGIGACQAVGMALEGRMLGKDYKVWSLLGDGELNEGAIWETAAAAAKYKLGNLVFIVDRNGFQMDDWCDTVMPMEPIDAKFQAFNWKVMSIDGHNMRQILETLLAARDYHAGPLCIIAKTIKGKGVSFMENANEWHGLPPNEEQYARAVRDLRGGTVNEPEESENCN